MEDNLVEGLGIDDETTSKLTDELLNATIKVAPDSELRTDLEVIKGLLERADSYTTKEYTLLVYKVAQVTAFLTLTPPELMRYWVGFNRDRQVYLQRRKEGKDV